MLKQIVYNGTTFLNRGESGDNRGMVNRPISGLNVSSAGATTDYTINVGQAVFYDRTVDQDNPPQTIVDVPLTVRPLPGFLSTQQPYAFVLLNRNGTISEQNEPIRIDQWGDELQLGIVTALDGINFTSAAFGFHSASGSDGISIFAGQVNPFADVDLVPTPATLNFGLAAGDLFCTSYSNYLFAPNNPHRIAIPTIPTPMPIRLCDRNGIVSSGTVVDPDQYDNAGVLTAVTAPESTIQPIFLDVTTGALIALYGQFLYTSNIFAFLNLDVERVITPPFLKAFPIVGRLVMVGGATDVTNAAVVSIYRPPTFSRAFSY